MTRQRRLTESAALKALTGEVETARAVIRRLERDGDTRRADGLAAHLARVVRDATSQAEPPNFREVQERRSRGGYAGARHARGRGRFPDRSGSGVSERGSGRGFGVSPGGVQAT